MYRYHRKWTQKSDVNLTCIGIGITGTDASSKIESSSMSDVFFIIVLERSGILIMKENVV